MKYEKSENFYYETMSLFFVPTLINVQFFLISCKDGTGHWFGMGTLVLFIATMFISVSQLL